MTMEYTKLLVLFVISTKWTNHLLASHFRFHDCRKAFRNNYTPPTVSFCLWKAKFTDRSLLTRERKRIAIEERTKKHKKNHITKKSFNEVNYTFVSGTLRSRKETSGKGKMMLASKKRRALCCVLFSRWLKIG